MGPPRALSASLIISVLAFVTYNNDKYISFFVILFVANLIEPGDLHKQAVQSLHPSTQETSILPCLMPEFSSF